MESRKFTGVFIPRKIWESNKVTPVQKMLLAEIDALSEECGYCYAGNPHFAKWLECSPQNISNHLRKLQDLGAVRVTFENQLTGEGRKIYLQKEFYYGKDPLTSNDAPPLTTGLAPLTTGLTEIQSKYKKESIGENANEYTFEQFWNDYDFKKGSKAKALQKFKKLSAKDRQDIKDTLSLYKVDTNTVEVAGPGWKPMRKYPEFYLSGRTWESFAERLAAQKAENETFAPEWSEVYTEYLGWVERCYPKSLNAAKFLSKQQYVRYKTTFYVEGKSYIDEKREREFLIQAHDDVEKNDDLRARVTDIFYYHCELIKERLKMYQI